MSNHTASDEPLAPKPARTRRKPEPWWIWHWDRVEAHPTALIYSRIVRWRRGSLLTVYRYETQYEIQWWLYGPFNLAVGFSIPKKGHTR